MSIEQILELLALLGQLGITVGAPVLGSWILIRGLALAGYELSNGAQKYVVYALSAVSVFAFQPIPLPEFSNEPGVFATALLAFGVAVMKAAQSIYDRAWKALENA